jgi:2-amino-4-hydroxy-6-hydroxymethyldihydropteridine diphosphokinase
MSTAVLSIGSNVGDRMAHLAVAVETVGRWLRAVSPVYETPPWGPVPLDRYLHAVLVVEDAAAAPEDWLSRAHAAEQAAGRTRDVRWGPRTLDVDVVTVDAVTSDDPVLVLPHPRAHERAFVLVPWLALDADAVLAGRRVADLLAELPEDEVAAVRRLEGALVP